MTRVRFPALTNLNEELSICSQTKNDEKSARHCRNDTLKPPSGFSTTVQQIGGMPNDQWLTVSDRYDVSFQVASGTSFTVLIGSYLGNSFVNVYKFMFSDTQEMYEACQL